MPVTSSYHDTYVGSEQFAGEEAVWLDGKAQYAMNYFGNYFWPCAGTAIQRRFLKDVLRHANYEMPYRGPEYYQSGEYTYKCSVAGDNSNFFLPYK